MANRDKLLVSFQPLHEARRNAPHTLISLSKETGVAYSYISDMESGKKDNPGIKVLLTLARALRCDVTDLFEHHWVKDGGGERE
jgi:transcriptional regulator with XRE-family HTH domain